MNGLPVQLLAAHHYNLPEHMFAYLSCDRCATPEVCAFTQDCPRLARPAPPSVARTGSPHCRPIPLAVPGVFTGMCARAGESDNFEGPAGPPVSNGSALNDSNPSAVREPGEAHAALRLEHSFARDNAKARTLSSSRGAASDGRSPARDRERAPKKGPRDVAASEGHDRHPRGG